MPIELFNPIGAPRHQDLDPVPRLDSLRGKTITLLSNTHPGVMPLLERVRELLEERTDVEAVVIRSKSNLSRPASDELRAEILKDSHAVITGVGT